MAIAVGLGFASAGCDSNPTPHPGNKGDDAYVDTASGGGKGETASPGIANESDPDDFADAMTPTGSADAGDVGDANADDNETSDAGDVGNAADGLGDVGDAGPSR